MHEIEQISPDAGMYRCAICGMEIVLKRGEPFPSCPSEDHTPRWVLAEDHTLAATS